MSEGRITTTNWKVLETGISALTDDNWADDVSDALPSTGIGSAPFERATGVGKNTAVEFFVLPYVAATGLLVDASAETFSVDVTILHDSVNSQGAVTPTGSSVVGRTAAGERVATRYATLAGCLFNVHYRFECDGADRFVLRLHTLSGTPTGATAYEVRYREVCE